MRPMVLGYHAQHGVPCQKNSITQEPKPEPLGSCAAATLEREKRGKMKCLKMRPFKIYDRSLPMSPVGHNACACPPFYKVVMCAH
jgi:hypothetical protein